MFSVRSLTSKAISAIRRTPSVAKSTSTPSVAISARYCAVSDASGSVRMRTKRSEEHTSELQSHSDLVCRLLLEKKKSQGGVREDRRRRHLERIVRLAPQHIVRAR